MAQSISGLTPFTTLAFSIHPQNATGNVAGGNVATTDIGGGLLSLVVDVGAVNTLTSVVVTAETSADGVSWVNASGIGNSTPSITITGANTTDSLNFLIPTGNVSQYVRANMVLTGTSANVTAMIFGQNRLDTAAGYTNAPPSGST